MDGKARPENFEIVRVVISDEDSRGRPHGGSLALPTLAGARDSGQQLPRAERLRDIGDAASRDSAFSSSPLNAIGCYGDDRDGA